MMKKLWSILLLPTCCLVSCTTKHGIGAIAAIGVAAGIIAANQNDDDRPKQEIDAIQVNESGQAMLYKGQLISPTELLHVTHWPSFVGETIEFSANNGMVTERLAVSKEDLGNDLSIVHLDRPVNPDQHRIYPIAEAVEGKPITIFRHWGKRPIAGMVDYSGNNLISADVDLVPGDSGGAGYQLINDKLHLVWLSSRRINGGESANLYNILNSRIQNQK